MKHFDGSKSSNRTKVGSSHEGQYTYWLDDSDLYIYQRRTSGGEWIGWLCSLPAWESTFSKSGWISTE